MGRKRGKMTRTRKRDEGKFRTYFKSSGIDEELGLVFGWAMVSKEDGEEYFDVQGDHITDAAILKSGLDFAENSRAANIEHEDPDSSTYVFTFPMTETVAKAYGIETPKYGLMVALKCSDSVFKGFKDKTYTGFSIEGSVIDEEAA